MKYLLLAFFTMFLTSSCGGGGGSTPATTTINIEGIWTITETDKPGDCAVPAPLETFNLTVTQNGSSITIEDEQSNVFSGTLNGYTLSWSGSYPDEAPNGVPGTTTLNSMTSTIDASCNSLTGTASWTWTATDGSGYSCSGTTTYAGTRTPASGCGFTTAPVSPDGLTASATSSESIGLSWSDNSDNETSFVLQSSTTSGTGYSTIATLTADETSYSHTGLSASTTYYYRIHASNDVGDSGYSNEADATTDVLPTSSPLPPSNLTALSYSTEGYIRLDWTDNSNNETGFEIWSSPSTMLPLTKKAEVGVNVTSYVDTGLSPTISYRYAVLAYNSVGSSALSNTVSASTSITKTFDVVGDSKLLFSSLDPTLAISSYSLDDNSVGCEWFYSIVQLYNVCAKSLLQFNLIYTGLDGGIGGKTIINATLKLYPVILPSDFNTQYKVGALTNTWNSSVTWNTQPSVYSGSEVVYSLPISSLPSEIDVTNIVQNWADGTYLNAGFLVEDTNYTHPHYNANRMTFYCGSEGAPLSCTQPPQLIITYY